jgi:hypothetical protein
MNELKEKIEQLYDKFFDEMNIDKTTGLLAGKNKRFATMPYIGSNYEQAKLKILFVGTDIGEDESSKSGIIQSFEERNDSVLNTKLNKKNPHIAGTYVSALNFLKKEYNWEHYWNLIDNEWTCQRALKSIVDLPTDVLSYVSLTNYYKFVTINRLDERSGGKDRNFISAEIEKQLFFDEVRTFAPDILILQSVTFNNIGIISEIKEFGINVYVAPHPANRKKNGRVPKEYMSCFVKI